MNKKSYSKQKRYYFLWKFTEKIIINKNIYYFLLIFQERDITFYGNLQNKPKFIKILNQIYPLTSFDAPVHGFAHSQIFRLSQLSKLQTRQNFYNKENSSVHIVFYYIATLNMYFNGASHLQLNEDFCTNGVFCSDGNRQNIYLFELIGSYKLNYFESGYRDSNISQRNFTINLNSIELRSGDQPQIAIGWQNFKIYFDSTEYRTFSAEAVTCLAKSFILKTINNPPFSTYNFDIRYLALSIHRNMEIYIDHYYVKNQKKTDFYIEKTVSNPNSVDMTILTILSFFNLKIIAGRAPWELKTTSEKITFTQQKTTFKLKDLQLYSCIIYYISIEIGLTSSANPEFQYAVQTFQNGQKYFYPKKLIIAQYNFFVGFSSMNIQSRFVNYSVYSRQQQNDIQVDIDSDGLLNIQFVLFIFDFQSQLLQSDDFFDTSLTMCRMCPQNCKICSQQGKCTRCFGNFTISSDQRSCECTATLISGKCYNQVPAQFKDCVTLLNDTQNNLKCIDCPRTQNKRLINNTCECMKGYERNNESKCVEKCGDGILVEAMCDDNNTNDNDGCSSLCELEKGFQCFNVPDQPTNCKYIANLKFKIFKIEKNQDQNSATMTLKLSNQVMPFALQTSQFASNIFEQPEMISLQFQSSITPDKPTIHNITLKEIKGQIMTLTINYAYTIEGINSTLYLNYSQTKYISKNQKIKFKMLGKNGPLKLVDFIQVYKYIKIVFLVLVIISMATFVLSLVSPKYIGLETVLLMQLIYLSEMLVVQQDQWPSEFEFNSNLKYSTGISVVTPYTTYLPSEPFPKKMSFLRIQKTYFENLTFHAAILVCTFIAFSLSIWIVNMLQGKPEKKETEIKKQRFIDVLKTKNLKSESDQEQSMKSLSFVNEIIYRVLCQVTAWCILPFLSACVAWRLIPNKSLVFLSEQLTVQKILNRLIPFFMLIIIVVVSCNNIGNIFLDPITIGRLKRKRAEFAYRKLNMIYLFLIGMLICYGNQVQIVIGFGCPNITMSLLIFILHALYMYLINIKIRPYSESLKIHSVSLFLNQFVYLVFLAFITLINMWKDMPPSVLLANICFISFSCTVLVVVSIFRLFMEFKYGQEYEIKLKDQQERKKLQKQLKQQRQRKGLLQLYELEAQKKNRKTKSINDIIRDENMFLYQNQLKQEKKEDLLMWLETRTTWTIEMKEQYYYKYFDSKPLSWIKKHQKQKYQQIRKEIKEKQNALQKKEDQKRQDPQYRKMISQMRKSYSKMKERQIQMTSIIMMPHIHDKFIVESCDQRNRPLKLIPRK